MYEHAIRSLRRAGRREPPELVDMELMFELGDRNPVIER
jgi:hypothetical protein